MIHVICLTYGEPQSFKWIEQFRYSHAILKRLTRTVVKIPPILLPFIAAKRAFQRRATQKKNWFHSPLEPMSATLCSELEKELNAKETERFNVYIVHEFRQPGLTEVLAGIDPSESVICVPLYLADGTFTSGISRTAYRDIQNRDPLERGRKVSWLSCPNGNPDFIDLVVKHILNACERAGLCREEFCDYALVLGAHGTLIDPPVGIENGLEHTLLHLDGLKESLISLFSSVRIGWLNHSRGGLWTQPGMVDVGNPLREAGCEKVVYYPAGFLTDNAETLLEGPALLGDFPERIVLPCLNNEPELVQFIAERIDQACTRNSNNHKEVEYDAKS
jgi:protoheme ferro-lyase